MHLGHLELVAPVHVQERLQAAEQRRLLRAAQGAQSRSDVRRVAAARLGTLLVRLGSRLQGAAPARGHAVPIPAAVPAAAARAAAA